MPAQCYRSQQFYHHSRFCNRTPKCLKYTGCHIIRNCVKNKCKTPAKGTLCEGPHLENFSGCAKNPLNMKASKSPTTNVWEERKKQLQNKIAFQTQSVKQHSTIPQPPHS
ncbi:nucleic-acid-binding protein from transposon X-element [Nephila pilipes]|uniref:Nucleic-acid-binding protein from transposon X-element n=1 Tax=Nephila pilipes TaxID=299642 RepID=A0A8X6NNC1_NEPPI|nr:nucleic-acid-binding protein from transposon X-element [Nephila pilipes]